MEMEFGDDHNHDCGLTLANTINHTFSEISDYLWDV